MPCDPRSVNPLLTIDERNDVRQSIAKAEEELQRLLNRRKIVTDDLSQLKKVLVIHRILPRETIGHIFSILCAKMVVSIPHNRHAIPHQITVSHVCSKWREIALATPVLWTNVEIAQPGIDEWVQVAMELVFNRAGMRGIKLALNMRRVSPQKMGKTFHDIVLPLHVTKLHLSLPLSALESVSQESDDIIANVDKISLSITLNPSQVPNSGQVSIRPQFLSRIRALIICKQDSLVQHLDLQGLPWAQMRYLDCDTCMTVSTISNILSQSPVLGFSTPHFSHLPR
ncbi:hypothetical protein JOM56_004145 [Amanita muscaria]